MSRSENSIAKAVLGNPWVRAGGIVLALALLCFVIYGLSFVLVPLLLAFIIAYILDPLVDWFEARKVSRGVTITALAILGFCALLSVPLYFVPYAIDQADDLAQAARESADTDSPEAGSWASWLESWVRRLPLDRIVDETSWRTDFLSQHGMEDAVSEAEDAAAKLEEVENTFQDWEKQDADPDTEAAPESKQEIDREREAAQERLTTAQAKIDEAAPPLAVIGWKISQVVKQNLRTVLTNYGGNITSASQQAGASVASFFKTIGTTTVSIIVFLGNLAIFAFVGIFLLKDYDGVVATIGSLVPPKARPELFRVMGNIDTQMRSFLVGQLTVCVCLALMYALGLALSGVPFWFLIALFGGFATLIPFFGVMMTFIPAALLTLIYYGIDIHLVYVIITFVVVQGLEGNVVTPTIMGNTVGLHPVWVILAVMVFGSLLGFAGLLIAVPLAAILKVLVVEAVEYYKASSLFEEESQEPS